MSRWDRIARRLNGCSGCHDTLCTDSHYRITAALERAHSAGYREGLEAAAKVADECWHGPGDHGCDHGREIAEAIRSLAHREGGGGE